ncbi:DUF1223 domain-containing protein [Ponticaulis profundi]|uniref:DUF1223 domain-containing protein n=1 Tax=Ponticaulis profundi TaxID=2665222 RepID=A0ABW1S967_9PROT
MVFPHLRSFLSNSVACLCVTAAGFCCSAVAEPSKSTQKSEPVLVELFSNQNCGACPKANKNLIDLMDNGKAFPIVWSVPYWDYLGWTDTYSKPEFVARQKAYAEIFDLRGPYTPQAVIDGCVQTSGTSKAAVEERVDATSKEDKPDIALRVTASALEISGDDDVGPVTLWLVGYKPGLTEVNPTAGGNAGKSLVHAHLATSLKKLATWKDGDALEVPLDCRDEACLVIVQEAEFGDILLFKPVPRKVIIQAKG